MDTYTIYYASNTLPPDWLLNLDDSISFNQGDKMRSLGRWECVLFVLDHKTKQFIPLSEEDKDVEIQDFKYLFNL